MRKLRFLAAAIAAVILLLPQHTQAAGSCSIFRSWTTGNSLTAPDLTTSFTTVGVTNMIPSCMQSVGTTLGNMQATSDPYSGQVAALPGTIGDEIEQLRFVIQQNFGTTFWYRYTDAQTIGPAAPSNSPTNQAGNALTLHSGSSTGTGVGGALNLRLSYPGGAGTGINALNTVMAFSGTNNAAAGVTALQTYTPIVNQSGTAGYTAYQMNVTQAAVGSGTKLLADFQVGGVSKFSIDAAGNVTAAGTISGAGGAGTFTTIAVTSNSNPVVLGTTNTGTFALAGGALTGARVWTLPDITGIVALTNGGQTFSSGVWNGSVIGTLYGGTGINTSATTTGSLLYTSDVGTWTTLTAGATGTTLRMGGSSTPRWDHDSPLMAAVFN